MEPCDPTVQNCDSIDPHSEEATSNEDCSHPGPVYKRPHLTSNDGLFLVSAIKLVAGIHLLVGSVWDDKEYLGQAPSSYQLYQSIINSVFGTTGVLVSYLGIGLPEET